MTRRVFTTTGWNQTGDPVDLGVIDGVQTTSYLSIDKAAAACVDRDVVEPCRPGMPGFSFYDADGNPLKTVVVPTGVFRWAPPRGTYAISGAWTRLVLDFGSARGLNNTSGLHITWSDVDFKSAYCSWGQTSGIWLEGSNVAFNRCRFIACRGYSGGGVGIWSGLPQFVDCEFIGSYLYNGVDVTSSTNQVTFTRCVYSCGLSNSTETDCVNYYGMTQEQLDATFVKPPQIGATWSADLWKEIDLRLLPTSQYASGATSVQSGQEVYDVAGNKRKVGGALGAYEVLDDAPTHYPCATTPGWRYTATRDDDSAPTVLNHCVYANADGSTVRQLELPNAATVERENSGAWSRVGRGTVIRTTLSATARLFRATYDSTPTDDSSFCYIQEYSPDQTTAEGYSNATPCKMKWTDGRFFLDGNKAQITSANGAPDSSSVVYLGENKLFSDDARGVGKIIQEGFVHTDLGGAEGEIILGRDSTAKTSGKLTWSGQTTTSAEALARLTPRAPAELTFKECDITDA